MLFFQICRRLNNFSTALALYSGMNMICISRLRHLWEVMRRTNQRIKNISDSFFSFRKFQRSSCVAIGSWMSCYRWITTIGFFAQRLAKRLFLLFLTWVGKKSRRRGRRETIEKKREEGTGSEEEEYLLCYLVNRIVLENSCYTWGIFSNSSRSKHAHQHRETSCNVSRCWRSEKVSVSFVSDRCASSHSCGTQIAANVRRWSAHYRITEYHAKRATEIRKDRNHIITLNLFVYFLLCCKRYTNVVVLSIFCSTLKWMPSVQIWIENEADQFISEKLKLFLCLLDGEKFAWSE